MTEGKNPPNGGSSIQKPYQIELKKVKHILNKMIEAEKKELERIDSELVIRGLKGYYLQKKYVTTGKVQALYDAYIFMEKIMSGDRID